MREPFAVDVLLHAGGQQRRGRLQRLDCPQEEHVLLIFHRRLHLLQLRLLVLILRRGFGLEHFANAFQIAIGVFEFRMAGIDLGLSGLDGAIHRLHKAERLLQTGFLDAGIVVFADRGFQSIDIGRRQIDR